MYEAHFCVSRSSFLPAVRVLADPSELRRQSEAHQMFPLEMRSSRHPHSTSFYEGNVTCAFNDIATCEGKFKNVLGGHRASQCSA